MWSFLPGGCSAAGGAEAGGERGRPSEHAGRSGERAVAQDSSLGAEQAEGEARSALVTH